MVILDWNDFFEKVGEKLMQEVPEVKAVVLNVPIATGPLQHQIMIDVYYEGQVSKKSINRFFSDLSEKLSGSVYRGKVYRRDKKAEVDFEGRMEPRLSVSILSYEHLPAEEAPST